MEIVSYFVDFLLHVDRHLEVFVQNYGTWVYALLFLIVFVETGLGCDAVPARRLAAVRGRHACAARA